jgi:hypothetical protein
MGLVSIRQHGKRKGDEKMYREDGSLSILGVWVIGGLIIFIATLLWALLAGPLTVILDTFTGLSDATSYSLMLSDSMKLAFSLVVVVADVGTLAWMITSSFKKESQELPF